MPKQSLQKIEDFYYRKGYRRERLRLALLKDKEHSRILKERKKKLSARTKVSVSENKKYVLSTDQDFDILKKCKQLERAKLTKGDKDLIKLIKTQLEDDWRGFLIMDLKRLMKKYRVK